MLRETCQDVLRLYLVAAFTRLRPQSATERRSYAPTITPSAHPRQAHDDPALDDERRDNERYGDDDCGRYYPFPRDLEAAEDVRLEH